LIIKFFKGLTNYNVIFISINKGKQSDARVSMMGYVVSCKADQRWGATGSRLVL
jgi:hypothetical protein